MFWFITAVGSYCAWMVQTPPETETLEARMASILAGVEDAGPAIAGGPFGGIERCAVELIVEGLRPRAEGETGDVESLSALNDEMPLVTAMIVVLVTANVIGG